MSILKKIKKFLRKYRALMAIGTILLSIVALLMLGNSSTSILQLGLQQEESIDVLADQPIKLILKTKFICGTEIETKEFDQVKDLKAWIDGQSISWILESKKDGEYSMSRKVINELSPLCKEKGYFGLSEEGVLTIFQGPPMDNQVIQTFFRIDTQLLESKLPKGKLGSLKQGIRIHTVDEYWSVLSTFGQFATEY
jgi:forespore regulator of the sigma-K checkpoint